ncbi:membrane protein [Tenacibaculum holothuriorum]|uniref:Membrane protein n=1 Tax=Tenacibaculum holothuriorum TaxID=1635173 RepID=A0A1Y2PDC0_9FLAO|nr:SusC/RagA family TonB-linked outer membrane protein [Tenacibaculum holothuriorum]OSY88486.1 membrane protein [Tenacibaculum holothuriorum]
MRTKFNGILTLLLAFFVHLTYAQDRTISGTVSDESGPLPGVTVLKKGTTQGTETGFNGDYSIKAKTGDVLVFSFVGMKNVERTVSSSNQINVTLENDNLLEEVVVVGYGTATKQTFVGSAKTVKSENLETKSFSNVSQALTGEVAGVSVINTSGQPGSTSTVRIRGFGSVNGNRAPLYVVDGVPFSGSLNSINPADIESSTVLKDASATAIYGARGANGVIIITTKSGKAGTSSIEVDVKTGVNFSSIPRQDVIKNPDTFIGLAWEALYNRANATGNPDPTAFANSNLFSGAGIGPAYNFYATNDVSQIVDPATRTVRSGVARKYTPENWADYAFQTSILQEANVRFSGGDEKSKYYASFGYLDNKGYIKNSDYKRYSTRLNLSSEVKPWLKLNTNIGYAISTTNNNGQTNDSGSIFWFADNIPSIYPLFLRDANGQIVPDPIFGGNQYDYGDQGRDFGALTNSISDALRDVSRTQRHEINGNVSANIDLLEGLTFETKLGLMYRFNDYISYNNPFYGSAASQFGSLFNRDTESLTLNFLNLVRYKTSFGRHNLEVLAAHETNKNKSEIETASKFGAILPFGGLYLDNFVNTSGQPSGYIDESTLESYFGQANYNFDGKYFLSASIRRDGSSRFVNNKWDTFGSIGASWILTKESFMDDVNWLKYLKVKASYGLIGEQSGVGLYPGYILNNASPTPDPATGNNTISIAESVVGNPDLTWETSKMFQTGIEFSVGDYLEGNLDYYVKNTDNLLFDREQSIATGFSVLTVNDGQLSNRGFEFDLTGHIINTKDYGLDVTVNGTFLDNELTAMPIDPATGQQKVIDIAGAYGRSVGRSLFDFYTREWAGVDPADGRGMWYQYYDDKNNNGTLDSGEESFALPNATTGNDDNPSGTLHGYQLANSSANIKRTTTKTYANATEVFNDKSTIPTVQGAFRITGRIKNFDISTQFLYSLGGYAYDGAYATLMNNGSIGNNNWHKDILNRWQKPGDITDVPRLSDGVTTNDPITGQSTVAENSVNRLSTRFITSSDFLSLNNVKVGYTLPKSFIEKAGVDYVNLWLAGDNLFLLSKRKGFNPSTSETGASSVYRYAPLTTITFGVRVKF